MKGRSRFDVAALAEQLLRASFAEDAAASVLGDLVEEVERRRENKNPVRFRSAWLIGQALLHVVLARRQRRDRLPRRHNPSAGRALGPMQRSAMFANVAIYELKHALRMMRTHPGSAPPPVRELDEDGICNKFRWTREQMAVAKASGFPTRKGAFGIGRNKWDEHIIDNWVKRSDR